MPIRNAKPKTKASSKTDAMKALTTPERAQDTESVEEQANAAPATPLVTVPRPAIPRPAPIAPKPVVRYVPPTPVNDGPSEGDAEAESETTAPGGKPKIAFDPQVWQWRDEGGFIHIKTGETREETEFLDPDAKSRATRDDDWDAPQGQQ